MSIFRFKVEILILRIQNKYFGIAISSFKSNKFFNLNLKTQN